MGTVYLVGGGPGDPGLLTVRARRLLKRADVVLHDALISPAILRLVPEAADRIDVGKRCGDHRTAQERIHEILCEAARRVRVVVRLKGGDPFLFGRGGEEALALRRAGIPFEVVPGITAALGAGAYAGVPLTHRGLSAAVTFVTGHECADTGEESVDWERLAGSGETLVVYMGISRLGAIAERLIRFGRSPATPAVVVQWATCPQQRSVGGPLFEIHERVRTAELGGPALVIIGDVAALRTQANWFEGRPLNGLRVLVPRSRAQPSRLARALASRGAEVLESPRFSIHPAERPEALREAIRDRDRYAWIMFTSPTAVDRFWKEAAAAGLDARAFASHRFACFGAATVQALRRRGVRPDVSANTFVPARVLDALRPALGAGETILFPGRGGARSALAAALVSEGVRVDEVEAYREVPDPETSTKLTRQLRAGGFSVIAFSSSTTVREFVTHHGRDVGDAAVAVIGRNTAATARALGLAVHIVSDDSTLRGLFHAIEEYAVTRRTPHSGAGGRRPRLASQP
jgi:uroporphyrinogen III methyltransferase/synthase